MDLFDYMRETTKEKESPLASRLRPTTLDEVVGQQHIIGKDKLLYRAIKADKLSSVIFYGPPGTGKTTLAKVIANTTSAEFTQINATVAGKKDMEEVVNKAKELKGMYQKRTILFIDEIHRLSPVVEEILYPALEDYQIDIMIGEGPAARSIKLDLPPFTLIGATTRAGSLTNPLRARFGIVNQLQFYTTEELITIVRRSARLLGVSIDPEGAAEIASRSRGTPRVANRLLRRVRDYAEVRHDGTITREVASAALTMLDVDPVGLDFIDRCFLLTILEKFSGGPVGIDNLAAAIGEDRDTLEDVVEPYLIQQGFLQRTPRGRMAAHRAWEHFKLTPPANQGGAVMRDATLF